MPENKKRQALKRTTSQLAIHQTESLRLSGFSIPKDVECANPIINDLPSNG
nr:MAG TPA: hypothetical protein [Caudoviricetes sp.]